MLHRLIIDSPSFKRIIYLQNSCYLIGRHPSNSIVIPSPQISRRHATLLKKINESLEVSFHIIDGDLEGNRSRNGVWINGDSYLEYELKHGDVITFGVDIKGYYQVVPSQQELEENQVPAKVRTARSFSTYMPQEQWENTITVDTPVQELPQERLKKLASIIEYNPYPIIEVNYQGEITYLNSAANERFALLTQEQSEHPLLQGILDGVGDRGGYIVTREVKINEKFFEQHIHYLAESPFIRSYIFDITERKIVEQSLNYQAFFDPLTDLPNRFGFRQELSRLINDHQAHSGLLAVLFLNLREFQSLNDTFGHTIADEVLCLVTERLRTYVRSGDMLCRWQGDEFAIILTTCEAEEEVQAVVQRLLKVLKRPFLVNNTPLYLQANIGIAFYPDHGENSDTLLMNANAALNDHQDLTTPHYRFYNPLITSRQSNRFKLERDLHRALERDEFLLYYQPRVLVSTGQIVGMEALLRWRSPDDGLIAPGQYINVLEESGLIIPIGEKIIRLAAEQQLIWQRQGLPPIKLAVNLSARQFQEPDLIADVLRIVGEVGLDPSSLEFEITETAVMQDVMMARQTLDRFQAAGINLALDDFGTGYSSLAYLKQFPFNTLKIDRIFVKDLLNSTEDMAIVKTIITLGQGFHLQVVAEGVETLEQAHQLLALGCEEMQGYWFSRPLPEAEMTQLLGQGGDRRFCV
ncbi:MAG: EAL domain-containing protein [Merismopediaceae bacterium]|nr:EAL domain-containing protein [Merismopediaceae bacterium]